MTLNSAMLFLEQKKLIKNPFNRSEASLSTGQKLPFQQVRFLQFLLCTPSGWGSNLSFIGSPPKMHVTLVEQCGNAALRSERCDERFETSGFRKTWVTTHIAWEFYCIICSV